MEILASELRIGNWYDHNGKHCQVSPNTILEVWESPRKWVQPIPLTPEILEKCGFDRNCILKIYQGVNIEWSYGKEVWLTKEGKVIYEFENTQHLHQLQNLYFSLTCEELTFKP